MEPQQTTQWLRLNHTFVTICQQQMEQILAEQPHCFSIHILDIEQSELVRVQRKERGLLTSDQLLNCLKEWSPQAETSDLSASVAIKHIGRGLGRYTVVGPNSLQQYLVEVPIFNLPLAISLVWAATQPIHDAKRVSREAVVRICEKYLSTVLNIPLSQETSAVGVSAGIKR
ncbi:hypothetical protein [Parvibium lacunae]|uniref:Uncharacterized protein n=1 Tax=Parvibium lacunae TaxID=1888893 RepID=A0A368L6S3_9BURK|nr:hypothetical protein [Parvibium lacunae]RCS59326.1 hypothetical protein DU000_00875 [Parvibium lacunae]